MIKYIKLNDEELELCEWALDVAIDFEEGVVSDEFIERAKKLFEKIEDYNRLKYDKTPFDL